MRLRTRMLGLGLLAVLAGSAVVVVDSSATAGGHFTSNRDKTTFEGIEQNHVLEFVPGEMGKGIICEKSTYHGVVTGKTFTEVTMTPKFGECKTTGGAAKEVTVTADDCTFKFTVRSSPETKHNTVHLGCPTGKITIQHTSTNCKIEIGPQTVEGVVYKKEQWEGTESITAEFTIKKIAYTTHNGLCALIGTNHTNGELKGGIIVKAWNTDKPKVEGADITAT